MSKTLYRTAWRCQEVEFENMDWDAFIGDTFNYLCNINDQNFIEVDKEFILKSEAEKYVKEHPVYIKRLPNCFFIRWLELYEVDFDEDDCETGCNLSNIGDLVTVSEFNLMNVPIVSNFDLISALNELDKDQIEKLISPL